MSVRVAALGAAAPDAWDAVWSACGNATFFHSRAWAECFAEALPGSARPDARIVRFDDGREALLPVSVRNGTALASPAGCYGGWISRDPLRAERADALVSLLLGLHPGLRWRIHPFDPLQAERVPDGAQPDRTHAVRLDDDFDRILRRWRKGHRAAAAQAQRKGVEVRVAKTEEDWRAYFGVYEETLRRWGGRASSRHPWGLFRALSRRDGARLWLAEHAGRLLAGALCLEARSHVVYWHGAARSEAFPLRPVHLLVRTAMHDAQRSGRAWFDFNPSGGHESVAAFKRHFGAEELACPVVVRRPPAGIIRRLLRRWV